MKFATAINCMDGRTQLPVNEWVRERTGALYVDTITEPGPNGILARQDDSATVRSILKRVDISVHKHGSRFIAVVGHHDCAGNPGERDKQDDETMRAVSFLKQRYPECDVVGVYVDSSWTVQPLD